MPWGAIVNFFYAGGGAGVLPQHVHGTELTSIQRIELLLEQGTKRERATKIWNEAVWGILAFKSEQNIK